ncbi:hypothetical protein LTR66_003812 [Elasticomyces elasticus]|nr:hypothetical protein LTR66_003812 [Elasticomyces elasticus]
MLRLLCRRPPPAIWKCGEIPCLPSRRCVHRTSPYKKLDLKKVKEERKREAETGTRPLTLLEELFPEEIKRRDEAAQKKHEREVPRLPLDPPAPYNPNEPPQSEQLDQDVAKQKRREQMMRAQGQEISVLVLRNASKNLVDDDFRRLIPQGKHIEGWTLEQGDIIKEVIPGRDNYTLERQNYYFLLFKSALSAFTYQAHVRHLHAMAQSHTPSSLTSPLPAPPGYVVKGEDVHDLLQNYALIPPSRTIDLRQLKPPLTPYVESIIQHMGYPTRMRRKDRSEHEVLLHLEGPQLSKDMIRAAIFHDGQNRALHWTGGHEGNIKVTKLDSPSRASLSPLGSRKLPDDDVFPQEGHEQSRNEHEGDDGEERKTPMAKPAHKFIIDFDSDEAAQTFVTHWHRKEIPLADFTYENGDTAPIVNAEVLW